MKASFKHDTKLAIVDDDHLLVELLTEFIHRRSSYLVHQTAFSGNEYKELLSNAEESPKLAIIDLKMSNGNGLELIEWLTKNFPKIKLLVLSSYYKRSTLSFIIKSGASAFVPKEIHKEKLLHIIDRVISTGHYFDSDQIDLIRDKIFIRKAPDLNIQSTPILTERETEVLKLICKQMTAKEIAEKIFVTQKTVEAHKGNLLLKTGAKNLSGLVIYAVQNQIVDPHSIMLMG